MAERDTEIRLARLESAAAELRASDVNRSARRALGGGDSLPKGSGKYKVLMIIDDLDPGTAAWDHIRFGSGG